MFDTKGSKKVILFGSLFFMLCSVVLCLNTSLIQPHQDVDSKAYLEAASFFYQQMQHFFEVLPGVPAWFSSMPYYSLGYPFIIAILYFLFGVSLNVILLFQVFLALISGLILFLIAHRMWGESTACLTFILFSCNLGFLIFAQFILTELVLAFLILLFIERVTAWVTYDQYSALLCAGVILGLSIVVKPAALYLLPLLVVLFLTKSTSCKQIIFFVLCFIVPVSSYTLVNKRVFRQEGLTSLSSINMTFWYLPNLLSHLRGTDPDRERYVLQEISSQPDGKQKLAELLWVTIRNHPVQAVAVWLKNVTKTFLGLYTSNLKVLLNDEKGKTKNSFFAQQSSGLSKLHNYIRNGASSLIVVVIGYAEFFYQGIRYVLSLLGLFFMLRSTNNRWLGYFFFFLILYFSLITGHDGCARFRMMFESLLILLTSYGFLSIFQQREMS